ncbi:MAG: OprO/OprP family phosphate-selective porin [Stenotrophobium sp.]
MIPYRKTVLAAFASGALLIASIPAFAAGQPNNAELMKLLQKQSAQIEKLKKRLVVIETAKKTTAAPAAAAQATMSNAEVEAAIADSKQSQIDALQAQVTALANGGVGGSGGNVRWTHGSPEFRSTDGFFTFQPRGRLGFDYSTTSGSSYAARNISGTEAEALRLGASGNIGALGYKLDVDFVDNVTAVKDAYLSWDTRVLSLPVEFYAGNHLKDRSIEGSSTESRLPFMERNAVAAVGAGVNGYYGLGSGVRVYGNNWHIGGSITGDDLDNVGTASDSVMYSIRGTYNPVKTANGFIHLGAWYYYETMGKDVATINNTPRIAQHFNDNLRVSASSITNPTQDEAYGYELGGVYRSFWSFAEYTKRTIDSAVTDVSDRTGQSWSAGWLITGEKPGFSSRSGVWGTTKVLRPVTSGGIGAFELAVRLDRYDFRNLPKGGTGHSTTVGLNWYLNDWARVMLNYVNWTTNNQVGSFQGIDDGNSIGLRTLLSF